jgi:hypothetical protein
MFAFSAVLAPGHAFLGVCPLNCGLMHGSKNSFQANTVYLGNERSKASNQQTPTSKVN